MYLHRLFVCSHFLNTFLTSTMLEVLALFARFKINNEKGTIVSKIAIIYFSKTDVTGQLARAIAAGVEQQSIKQQGECEILSHRIEGSEIIEGRFVHVAKRAMERYHIRKLRAGITEPIFERLLFRIMKMPRIKQKAA